jgi:hypothetical protein
MELRIGDSSFFNKLCRMCLKMGCALSYLLIFPCEDESSHQAISLGVLEFNLFFSWLRPSGARWPSRSADCYDMPVVDRFLTIGTNATATTSRFQNLSMCTMPASNQVEKQCNWHYTEIRNLHTWQVVDFKTVSRMGKPE